MVEIAVKALMGMVLILCGIQDIRQKKISLWIIAIGAVAIVVCVPFCHSCSILDRLGGLAVGVIVTIISIATRGKIGMGDGMILCLTGLGLGFWVNLELFAIALFVAAIISIILLIARRVDRKKAIPFVPFLVIGYAFLVFAGS